jgi:hypothetical protein
VESVKEFGLASVKELIQGIHLGKLAKGEKVRKVYSWQDLAVRMANDLGINIKNDKGWFKFFKTAVNTGHEGLLYSAFTFCSDANHPNKRNLFYWHYYNNVKKNHKETS